MEKFPCIVADIMSAPAITIDGKANVRDAAIQMTEKGIGSLVITKRGKAEGIITKRDIIQRLVSVCKDPCETKVKEIMSSPLITTTSNTGILAAMRRMRESSITQIVVMDGKELVGIVSERDVLKAVSIASLTSFSTLLRTRG